MATDDKNPPVTPSSAEDSYDAMSSVFDELATPETPAAASTEQVEGGEPAATPEAAAAPAAPDPEGGSPPATTIPPATDATPAVVPPAASGEPTPSPSAEPPPGEVDWKARAEELQAKLDARVPVEEPVATPAEPTPPPEVYTTEEKAFLTEYDKEWPDIIKGEALKRKAEYNHLVSHVFSEIQRVWGPLIERGSATAEVVSENQALAAIREVHDDYDMAMYDAVIAWTKGLTGMRRKLADATIAEGEPADVVDLITEFKSATGRSKPRIVADAAAPPTAPAAPVVTDISAAAKKAASAMGVVESKRTAVVQAADPNDFDAAWEESAAGSK